MQLFVRVGGASEITVIVSKATLILTWMGAYEGGIRIGGHGVTGLGWGPVRHTRHLEREGLIINLVINNTHTCTPPLVTPPLVTPLLVTPPLVIPH